MSATPDTWKEGEWAHHWLCLTEIRLEYHPHPKGGVAYQHVLGQGSALPCVTYKVSDSTEQSVEGTFARVSVPSRLQVVKDVKDDSPNGAKDNKGQDDDLGGGGVVSDRPDSE